MTYRKKLIEVALPLDAINKESAREKSIRHGHPSTLHLWWARRPLAACRAVLFAQLVDDPSEYMPDEKSADEERQRLFDLIEELVKWENINNEDVLDRARLEIARSVARDLGEPVPESGDKKHRSAAIREFLATKAPPVLDPFAGGGSIPLEAQRLGLRAYASDLNPVAVLINKALIEIPPRFAGMPPVHPPENKEQQLSLMKKEWKGAEGLAEDVRYYGKWMRDEAEKRIGHLYPKYKITQELLDERPDLKAQGLKPGDELTVIAWLWARTVKCPNPACGAQMPLAASFILSSKKGRQAWVEPYIDNSIQPARINFTVKTEPGTPPTSSKIGRGAQFRCLVCDQISPEEAIRAEFKSKRNGAQLMAVVADGTRGRVYLPTSEVQVRIAQSAKPLWMPEEEMNTETPTLVSGRGYGITHWYELFTPRQLAALTTFSDLVGEVHQKICQKSCPDRDPKAYADAVATYLAFILDKQADLGNALNRWEPVAQCPRQLFARQAIPMVWDYAEGNPLGDSSGSWNVLLQNLMHSFVSALFDFPRYTRGIARQADARRFSEQISPIISTDPPYYDNIAYADLSDFFYVWLRRPLRSIYSELFSTMAVPKNEELVATSYRFNGNKQDAEKFFEDGLRQTFHNLRQNAIISYPITVYYAFKQSESENDKDLSSPIKGRASTGWETMLAGLIESGFEITGTWPMRTEMSSRMVGQGTNALASSIVLVCRTKPQDAPTATRRDFLASLKHELPQALRKLQHGSIAPVDLAQAAIGPGMAVFSRYTQVLEADGSPMSVRTALALINQALDEFLSEQEGEYDADTRWALAWYEQYGFNEGPYGVAETLSKAKNTSVGGLAEAGVLVARAGKVRLLSRTELKEDWNPTQDKRPTAWEAVQYLIRALDTHGEQGAALLLSRLGGLGEVARDLAYRLYTICERKGWAQDALGYNMLVVAWPRLKEMARSTRPPEQGRLL
jgi:putative DNA methylase